MVWNNEESDRGNLGETTSRWRRGFCDLKGKFPWNLPSGKIRSASEDRWNPGVIGAKVYARILYKVPAGYLKHTPKDTICSRCAVLSRKKGKVLWNLLCEKGVFHGCLTKCLLDSWNKFKMAPARSRIVVSSKGRQVFMESIELENEKSVRKFRKNKFQFAVWKARFSGHPL